MKIRIVFFIFLFIFVSIIVKLFYLQVISPYQTNNSANSLNKIMPERGIIYDRNLQPLVLNQAKYRLYAEPKIIESKDEVIEKISDVLDIDESTIAARIDDSKDWVSVITGLDTESKEKLEALKLKGLGFEDEYYRYYPEASLSAHILGFVGKNEGGDNVGYFGLEGYYNKDLSGLPGLIRTEKDLLGKYIFIGNQQKIEAEDGRNLVLTIDKSVQEIAKSKLLDGIERYKASEGCVIIADPNNMEILAMT
ncbi:MAG: hypothetical protein WEC80_02495, partial [Patescibacteria group bacterium]